jgi:hypothetical protein
MYSANLEGSNHRGWTNSHRRTDEKQSSRGEQSIEAGDSGAGSALGRLCRVDNQPTTLTYDIMNGRKSHDRSLPELVHWFVRSLNRSWKPDSLVAASARSLESQPF